ncbi:hypothetical protein DCD74_07150 [Lysobacter oculi]|uniref:Type I restriction modification DNA specificity domain-containing protein n=1 Tax=Solilutibacter oculi TaxID=2698682 RepID=A0A344J631_9GAMM|nr:restriction endonuclease subunit S [Lysobacter oculi]AXA84491.1 hypothetical protein DCD74_07150 [Lysobacter oculi]
MSEYASRPIGDVIAKHVGGGTPSRQVASYWNGNIPWASVKDFPEEAGVIEDTEEHISPAGLGSSASTLIPAGVPLVCTRMAIGRAAMPAVPMAINQDVKALFPKDGVPSSYLLKLLRYIRQKAEDQSVGSTVKGIRVRDYLEIEVPIADDDARPVIAQILDTLDTAIAQTEAIIAKLKAVKQGLLHDLLTRGIDANGELRPPQSEAPQLYKHSALGWIPREWEEVTLGEIAKRSGGLLQTGPFGSQLHAHEYAIEGVPVLMPQDMVDGEFSIANIARITERKAIALARHRVRPNDLVFSRRGDLSRCVAIGEQQTGWLCGTGCLLARLPSSEVNAFWLALVYQQPATQSQVMGRAVGSTMANLNTSILASITIGRPVVNEQDEIVSRVASASLRIRTEEQTLQKLYLEKAGLMDDLLTGRVRVTSLLARAQHEMEYA